LKTKTINTIYLFASVIIPELEDKPVLREKFIINFERLFIGLTEESKQKLIVLFLFITGMCLLYSFSSFNKLNNARRKRYVDRLFLFPNSKVIAGLTGLRTLCFISYYEMEELWSEINYEGPKA
jgi:hypothetical protein